MHLVAFIKIKVFVPKGKLVSLHQNQDKLFITFATFLVAKQKLAISSLRKE